MSRAAEIRFEKPLHRVDFNQMQLSFARLDYEKAEACVAHLVADECDFSAACFTAAHRAAARALIGTPDAAREAIRAFVARCEKSSGKLDAQLAQRARAWMERGDDDLPLCAIEVHYTAGYLKSYTSGSNEQLAGFVAHALPILERSMSSDDLEPRIAASLIAGVLARDAPAGGAEDTAECKARALELLTRASDGAASSEHEECADRWVGPFADLELAQLHLAARRYAEASDALDRASALPARHFSFHSWLQSAVREARARVKRARDDAGSEEGDGEEGDGEEGDGEEEGEDEADDVYGIADLCKQIEEQESGEMAHAEEAAQ